jgi:hypothetical protein
VRHSEQAIYTDEGSANLISRYNVVESPYARAHFAEDFGRKHSIVVQHYFITEPKWRVNAPDCYFTDYTICTNAVWPPEAQTIIKEAGIESAFQDIIPTQWKSALSR